MVLCVRRCCFLPGILFSIFHVSLLLSKCPVASIPSVIHLTGTGGCVFLICNFFLCRWHDGGVLRGNPNMHEAPLRWTRPLPERAALPPSVTPPNPLGPAVSARVPPDGSCVCGCCCTRYAGKWKFKRQGVVHHVAKGIDVNVNGVVGASTSMSTARCSAPPTKNGPGAAIVPGKMKCKKIKKLPPSV